MVSEMEASLFKMAPSDSSAGIPRLTSSRAKLQRFSGKSQTLEGQSDSKIEASGQPTGVLHLPLGYKASPGSMRPQQMRQRAQVALISLWVEGKK